MISVSIPVTDALCDELVAGFADVLATYREALAHGVRARAETRLNK
jgi:hypothetical protein